MTITCTPPRPGDAPPPPGNQPVYLRLHGIRVIWISSPFEKEELFLEAGACRLFFCLKGTLEADGFIPEEGPPLRILPGYCGFIFHPLGCACRPRKSDADIRAVAIDFPYQDILQLLGSEELSRSIWHARQKKHTLGLVLQTTPAMQRLLGVMEAQAGNQGTGPLLVAARAMELLWLFVENHTCKTPRRIADSDRRAVQRARIVLEQQMADPPSLSQLAKTVGMSRSKLKKLFPDVCGLTPYGYLRRARMERALCLIRNNGMSVTEAAFEVGYNSLSRFSKVFAEHFGFNPSEARKL
jgi:AraC-like DNA-binding protein